MAIQSWRKAGLLAVRRSGWPSLWPEGHWDVACAIWSSDIIPHGCGHSPVSSAGLPSDYPAPTLSICFIPTGSLFGSTPLGHSWDIPRRKANFLLCVGGRVHSCESSLLFPSFLLYCSCSMLPGLSLSTIFLKLYCQYQDIGSGNETNLLLLSVIWV